MNETQIKKMVEQGEFVSVKNRKKEIERYKKLASNFNKKSKKISVQISEDDLYKLKLKALTDGMDYENIVKVLIHKFVNEEIKVVL